MKTRHSLPKGCRINHEWVRLGPQADVHFIFNTKAFQELIT